MVDGVGGLQDQLGDGNNGVAFVDEATENGGEGLRRVESGVVEQHDAPRLYPGGHPLADGLCVVVLPVQGVHIPLDRLHAYGADGGDDVVIVFSVGAADQCRGHAGGGTDALVAGGNIVDDLLGRQTIVVVMMVGVAHDLVACAMEGLDRLRIFLRPVAYDEEGGLYVVFLQDVDERLGILVAPR